MAKKGGSQTSTVTTNADPATAAYYAKARAAAEAAGNTPGTGIDPTTVNAQHGFEGYARAGQNGLAALSGDPTAFSGYMNPYQAGVLDQVRKQFGLMRADTTNQVDDAATQAGAFGGSRSGVAEGVALGQLGQGEQQQLAGLTAQGYEDAMGRAGTAANLGMGANGALASLGDEYRTIAEQNNPSVRKFNFLMEGMQVPPGSSTETQTTPMHRNAGAGLLGGATSGAEIGGHFGMMGAGIGAGVGGLMGLFG